MKELSSAEKNEIEIQVAKESIALADTLQRLYANKDFQAIIEDGYMGKEANRLIRMKAATLSTDQARTVDGLLSGIGGLYGYFSLIERNAQQALADLPKHEETREELAQEIN